jgi:dihydroflavonol-4-reductase
MKTILLTGADGMLGNHIIRELIRRNYQVVALIEPNKSTGTLGGLPGVSICHGDILDPQSLLAAFQGCDGVIHAAANTNLWPARSALQWQINLNGTLHVISSALAANVKKMVYVGTASTFGYGSMDVPGNETTPSRNDRFGLDYVDSKRNAHYAVLEAVHAKGLPATIVCPTFIFGAYDGKPSSGAMIVYVFSKKLLTYINGGRNFIYAGDVATGIVNALENGRTGEAYILGNQNLSYREAFSLIAQVIGKSPPGILVPPAVVIAFGTCASAWARMTRHPPTISYEMARISVEGQYYSAEKAICELNLPQTSIKFAIQEAYDWLCRHGALKSLTERNNKT